LKINDVDLRLQAEIPKLTELTRADIKIGADKTSIAGLLDLLPEEYRALLEGYNIDGGLTVEAEVKYDESTPDTMQYSGNMTLRDIAVSTSEYPGDMVIKSGKAAFKNDYADIEISEASFENNPLSLTCEINGFDKPVVDGAVDGKIDLATLKAYLLESGNPQLTGEMAFDMKFNGPVEQPGKMKLQGDLNVTNATYSAETLPEPIEALDISAKIDDRDIIINSMKTKFTSSDFDLKGKLADAFPYFIPGYEKEARKPFLSFEMHSNRLDIDKLFPEAAPGEGENLTELPLDSLPPIILPDIDGKGIAKVDTLIYSRVEFSNINGDVDIKDRVIRAQNVTGKVYTGDVKGEAAIDLNDFENPAYSGKYEAAQIEVNDFLSRFTGLGGHLFGKVNMNGDFNAAGWEPEDLIKSLTLDGSALINQAKLVNFDLVKKMAQTFNFSASDEETIKDLASSFRVENGRVMFDAMTFFNNMGDWNIAGSVGFDGSLDYSGDVLLTEKMSGELMKSSDLVAGVASMLKEDKSERVRVGFKLGGTYKNPKPVLDLSPAKEKLEDKLKDKVGDALKGLFGK